jgi:hypothetical protein
MMALVSLSSYDEEFGRSIQLPKCNREACTETFAPCFNKGTKTYYCVACARDMNVIRQYDGSVLCDIPSRDEMAKMEEIFFEGDGQYVGTRRLKDVPELLGTGYTAYDESGESDRIRRELGFSFKSKGPTEVFDLGLGDAAFGMGDEILLAQFARDHSPLPPVMADDRGSVSWGDFIFNLGARFAGEVFDDWVVESLVNKAHRAMLKARNKRKKQARARTGRRRK